MLKQFLLLTCFLFTTFSYAQQSHICAAHKAQMANSHKVKTRAALSDNLLMSQYDVKHYFLELDVENDTIYINGATTITAEVSATQLDTFAFELNHAHNIDSIVYNNQNLNFLHTTTHMCYAYLPAALAKNTIFSIKIYYHGTCASTNSAIGYGFSTKASPSWGNKVTWSLSQPYVAFDWFPCKQFLLDKADSSKIYITTSLGNRAGSNGVLEGIDTLGAKVRYRWNNTQTINYYLLSVAVAQYDDYSYYAHLSNGDSVLMQNYIYNNPNTFPAFQSQIDTVGLQLRFFDSLLIPYAYANQKYGHCMAPFSGGMEHQTMTSLGFFDFGIDAHELFHQWFGDLVTCSTWKDIFINEGFASYGEYLAEEQFHGNAAKQALMQSVHNNVMSQAGGSIYFTDTFNTNRIFSSRLSYDKGNAVIHSLRFVLGDQDFFATLRAFLNQYKNSNAGIEDLKAIAQNISGKTLDTFFNQWIYGEGYPTYTIDYNSNGQGIVVKVAHNGSMANTPLFVTPLELTLKSASGDTTVLVDIHSNSDIFEFSSAKNITGVVVDPNNWILNKTGLIKANPGLFPTSLNNNAGSSIQVFPNPVQNELFVACEQIPYQLSIRDAFGQMVYSKTCTQKSNNINTQQWPSGIYELSVQFKDKNILNKKINVIK